ncbi:MAG: serine/threonine-protein kinase, partial [Planctomycetota bacterium]
MKQDLCKTDTLVHFLEETLSEQQERDLISHLDHCDSCAQELERLAAISSRWQQVQSFLSQKDSRTTPVGEPTTENYPLRSEDGCNNELPFSIRQILSLLDPTDEPTSLGRMGSFEVLGVVGSGAMGVVVKAFDPTLDRVVALKLMNPTLAACGTARHRFAREAKAAAGVLHPNVVAIHGVSTERELPYLVMPYIPGESLQQRLDRRGPLELSEILRIGSQVAAGLAAAHQKGLIHRDIKPSNIMLDTGVETALITDFGLARTIDDATMTRTGAITGTPEFMSPEQARGDAVNCASDIFSLGSVLYSLCTGKRPFRAKTSFGVLRKITDEFPTSIRDINPDVPKWLCRLVETMHSKSPDERPNSAQVRDWLESCLAHVYQPDRMAIPNDLLESSSQNSTRFVTPFLVGVCLTMALLIFTIVAFAMPLSDGSKNNKLSEKNIEVQDSSDDPGVFRTVKVMLPRQGKKGKLKVDVKRGFIDVATHEQPGIVIEILKPSEYLKPDNSESKIQRFFTPQYDIDTDVEYNLIEFDSYNQDYDLNLRIRVPQNIDLDLDSYDNGIRAKGVTGAIKAESQHGSIELTGISGSANAYSRNGDLTISFESVGSDNPLDFEAYNGNIELSL